MLAECTNSKSFRFHKNIYEINLYVLPYGQMSLWGATVITNLMSAIPWIGQDIVEFLWGGFSVNNATLNRFFSLHFVLPFVLAALVLMHLIALHESAGSGNPVGVAGNIDRIPFAPYYIFKDLVTVFLFIVLLSSFVFFMPNILGDSENYVMANPMQTPPAIVPEWYLLPFYAILRSIPNKLFGVIAMFSAILILLVLPITDLSRSRGIQFRPLSKISFYVYIGNFIILMQLGAKHVESPFIEFGQISTVLYFAYFLAFVPFLSLMENTFLEFPQNVEVSYNYNSLSLNTLNSDISSTLLLVNISDLTSLYSIFVNMYSAFVSICIRILPIVDYLTFGTICDWGLNSQMATASGILTALMILSSIDHKIGFWLVLFYGQYYLISLMAQQIRDFDFNDSPRPWGIYFQDSGTPQMEGLTELHDNIMFYLVIILFAVAWILLSVMKSFNHNVSPIAYKYTNHGTLVELIWTITPALILILLAFPSFKLLYLMDEISDPSMAVLAEGHQWYWSYQYPDFLNSNYDFIEFDSYLVPEADLEVGSLRMLEVDNRVIIPELTHVRFIVTAADVIHSFACPSLGIKCDAYPGRLNQMSVLINRQGTFYGQCSEICGILHSSMPIVIESVAIEKFLNWLEEQ